MPKKHDVGAWVHFERKQDTSLAIVGDVTFRARIFAHHAGDVLHADDIAQRVGIHNLFLNFSFGGIRIGNVNRYVHLQVFNFATAGGEALRKQIHHQHVGANPVGADFVVVYVYGNLFFQRAVPVDVRHRRNLAQAIFKNI